MSTSENLRISLLAGGELPSWLQYPAHFQRLLENGLVQFRPWKILDGPLAFSRMTGLKERFPARELFPFALRTDCDDVACWERSNPSQVVIIHDFADPGWEQRAVFQTFWDWFRAAFEDFIEFEP